MRRKWFGLVVLAGLLLVSIPNLQAWFGNNSALKDADKQAIEWLNQQEGSHYTATAEVAPWIYGRFLDKEYVESVEEADWVIARSEPMTPRCDEENVFYKERAEVRVEGLEMLEEFDEDGVEVTIYGGGQHKQ